MMRPNGWIPGSSACPNQGLIADCQVRMGQTWTTQKWMTHCEMAVMLFLLFVGTGPAIWDKIIMIAALTKMVIEVIWVDDF